MARRKIVLIFVFMILFVLVLSPWASAPSPSLSSMPAAPRKTQPEDGVARPPAAAEELVRLKASVAMDETEFAYFRQTVEEQSLLLPDISLDLVRVEPEEAGAVFLNASGIGEPPDVMLMENERVLSFAVSGYLAPVGGAFSGEALPEPFDALAAPLKWNGYIWGVPKDFDPYVIVWNTDVLGAVRGNDAPPPGRLAEWAELASLSRSQATPVSWLAVDGEDPTALLSWVQAATGERTDTLWSEEDDPWSGTPLGEAIALLDRERAGIAFGGGPREIGDALAEGRAAAAVVPHSEAERLVKELDGVQLAIDRSAWKLPFLWPRGRSFVISSRSEVQDAANRWIAAMTRDSLLQDNRDRFGKLPARRSLYPEGGSSSDLFPGGESAAFPFQPPADFGPDLAARLDGLARLWGDFAAGTAGLDEWSLRWTDLSADSELYD